MTLLDLSPTERRKIALSLGNQWSKAVHRQNKKTHNAKPSTRAPSKRTKATTKANKASTLHERRVATRQGVANRARKRKTTQHQPHSPLYSETSGSSSSASSQHSRDAIYLAERTSSSNAARQQGKEVASRLAQELVKRVRRCISDRIETDEEVDEHKTVIERLARTVANRISKRCQQDIFELEASRETADNLVLNTSPPRSINSEDQSPTRTPPTSSWNEQPDSDDLTQGSWQLEEQDGSELFLRSELPKQRNTPPPMPTVGARRPPERKLRDPYHLDNSLVEAHSVLSLTASQRMSQREEKKSSNTKRAGGNNPATQSVVHTYITQKLIHRQTAAVSGSSTSKREHERDHVDDHLEPQDATNPIKILESVESSEFQIESLRSETVVNEIEKQPDSISNNSTGHLDSNLNASQLDGYDNSTSQPNDSDITSDTSQLQPQTLQDDTEKNFDGSLNVQSDEENSATAQSGSSEVSSIDGYNSASFDASVADEDSNKRSSASLGADKQPEPHMESAEDSKRSDEYIDYEDSIQSESLNASRDCSNDKQQGFFNVSDAITKLGHRLSQLERKETKLDNAFAKEAQFYEEFVKSDQTNILERILTLPTSEAHRSQVQRDVHNRIIELEAEYKASKMKVKNEKEVLLRSIHHIKEFGDQKFPETVGSWSDESENSHSSESMEGGKPDSQLAEFARSMIAAVQGNSDRQHGPATVADDLSVTEESQVLSETESIKDLMEGSETITAKTNMDEDSKISDFENEETLDQTISLDASAEEHYDTTFPDESSLTNVQDTQTASEVDDEVASAADASSIASETYNETFESLEDVTKFTPPRSVGDVAEIEDEEVWEDVEEIVEAIEGSSEVLDTSIPEHSADSSSSSNAKDNTTDFPTQLSDASLHESSPSHSVSSSREIDQPAEMDAEVEEVITRSEFKARPSSELEQHDAHGDGWEWHVHVTPLYECSDDQWYEQCLSTLALRSVIKFSPETIDSKRLALTIPRLILQVESARSAQCANGLMAVREVLECESIASVDIQVHIEPIVNVLLRHAGRNDLAFLRKLATPALCALVDKMSNSVSVLRAMLRLSSNKNGKLVGALAKHSLDWLKAAIISGWYGNENSTNPFEESDVLHIAKIAFGSTNAKARKNGIAMLQLLLDSVLSPVAYKTISAQSQYKSDMLRLQNSKSRNTKSTRLSMKQLRKVAKAKANTKSESVDVLVVSSGAIIDPVDVEVYAENSFGSSDEGSSVTSPMQQELIPNELPSEPNTIEQQQQLPTDQEFEDRPDQTFQEESLDSRCEQVVDEADSVTAEKVATDDHEVQMDEEDDTVDAELSAGADVGLLTQRHSIVAQENSDWKALVDSISQTELEKVIAIFYDVDGQDIPHISAPVQVQELIPDMQLEAYMGLVNELLEEAWMAPKSIPFSNPDELRNHLYSRKPTPTWQPIPEMHDFDASELDMKTVPERGDLLEEENTIMNILSDMILDDELNHFVLEMSHRTER